jgi:hypothetical protein
MMIAAGVRPTSAPRGLSRVLVITGAALLAACAGVSPPTAPPRPGKMIEAYEAAVADGITLDFEVERRQTAGRDDACYSLFSGTLKNASGQTVSRHAVLDFIVISKAKTLFRDITQPLADIPPGGKAAINLFASPVHRGACPDYDRIDVTLRPPGMSR